jgi:hypothetical protein
MAYIQSSSSGPLPTSPPEKLTSQEPSRAYAPCHNHGGTLRPLSVERRLACGEYIKEAMFWPRGQGLGRLVSSGFCANLRTMIRPIPNKHIIGSCSSPGCIVHVRLPQPTSEHTPEAYAQTGSWAQDFHERTKEDHVDFSESSNWCLVGRGSLCNTTQSVEFLLKLWLVPTFRGGSTQAFHIAHSTDPCL